MTICDSYHIFLIARSCNFVQSSDLEQIAMHFIIQFQFTKVRFITEKKLMKLLILPFLFLHQLVANPSFSKAKYSKCIVEDAGNVEVSGLI